MNCLWMFDNEQILTSLPADEGPLWSVRDSLPHSDGFGVSWVGRAFLLIVAPVLVSFEKVGFSNRLPAQRRVDAVFGKAAVELHQAVRVTRLSCDLLKHPVLITWKVSWKTSQHFRFKLFISKFQKEPQTIKSQINEFFTPKLPWGVWTKYFSLIFRNDYLILKIFRYRSSPKSNKFFLLKADLSADSSSYVHRTERQQSWKHNFDGRTNPNLSKRISLCYLVEQRYLRNTIKCKIKNWSAPLYL